MNKKWKGLLNVGAICIGTYFLCTALGFDIGFGIGILVWSLLPWEY